MSTVTLSKSWSYDRTMRLLGGMWFPLTEGSTLQKIGEYIPSYWISQAARVGVGADAGGAGVLHSRPRSPRPDPLWTGPLRERKGCGSVTGPNDTPAPPFRTHGSDAAADQ